MKQIEESSVVRLEAEANPGCIMTEVATKADLALAIEIVTLRLTIRIGSMVVGAIPLSVGAQALLQHVLH